MQPAPHVAVIGAGIGGLAAALRLAHRGLQVTVLERHGTPGGKMRTIPSVAGPVDAGPTVLTMKPVFDALFADVGERIEDHVTLETEGILARHFWPDGCTLDLMRDPVESRANVERAFGSESAQEFTIFSNRAKLLFETFDAPMMRSSAPSLTEMAKVVAKFPRVIPAMAPLQTLGQSLRRHFSDPRLAQLFARYATYVGGLPDASPALLGLIWHAECQGVWHVRGGMHQLAQSIATCATRFGAQIHYNTHVTRIETQDDHTCAVHTENGRIAVDAVLFNGDTAALAMGTMGAAAKSAVPKTAASPRSLSASVLSFAATPADVPLAAHNVFFADDPESEYAPLVKGQPQTDPTLYVCAQDRFGAQTPNGPERFEIILNSPPVDTKTAPDSEQCQKEKARCQTLILNRLARFGLTFSHEPNTATLTIPQDFNALFPNSGGSLYGRSPHGMMAAFKRPTARTALKGLYLTGGGAHPGAGVPMATLSAKHAAEAILSDLTSTSTFPQGATRGGTSTVSATMAPAPSRSSVS